MALTITQKMRADIGGKAWRTYEITHDGTQLSVSAASMDMHYIDAIVGQYNRTSMTTGSLLIDFVASVAANNESIQWTSVDVSGNKSWVTVIGW